jgi:hypothetical protein
VPGAFNAVSIQNQVKRHQRRSPTPHRGDPLHRCDPLRVITTGEVNGWVRTCARPIRDPPFPTQNINKYVPAANSLLSNHIRWYLFVLSTYSARIRIF